MPALQRTPPQRVARSPIPPSQNTISEPIQDAPPITHPPVQPPQTSRPSEGNTTLSLPTPSRAFIPRNQKVMRTPPGGTAASSGAMPPPAVPTPSKAMPVQEERGMELDPAELQEDDEMFVEEQILAGTSTAPRQSIYAAPPPDTSLVSNAPSTTPTKSPPIAMSTTPLETPAPTAPAVIPEQPTNAMAGPSSSAVPVTPAAAPRTPRTRLNAPAPIDDSIQSMVTEEASRYGKRYEITLDTLRLATKNAALKWTRRDLEGIFPLLAAKFPEEIRHVHSDASASMRERIDADAKYLFEHYRVGKATQLLDEVVADAKAHGAEGSEARADAWRPDLSPEALTAAANLAIYDEVYDRLRTEYLALHKDCSTRFASIQAKQAELAELESSVSEGVTELDKTLAVLDGFPTGDMKDWAETTMGVMEGGRVAERA